MENGEKLFLINVLTFVGGIIIGTMFGIKMINKQYKTPLNPKIQIKQEIFNGKIKSDTLYIYEF